LIELLHKNLVYVRGDKDITATLDSARVHPFIPEKKWRDYCVFQSEYKERLHVLRAEKREVPKESGADKNMPPILQTWDGKFSATQQPKNFKKQMSCAFTEERVKQYEELNKSFVPTTKLPAPAAAAKIIPLMIMDMAYLKSFEVDWDGACPALETTAVADDDDDDDIDTSAWDVTDPSTIPFNNLRIPKKGKLPTALLYAASLLAVAEPRPQNVGSWISALVDRFNDLKAQTSSNDLNDIITRPMTAHEEEMYTQFLNRDDDDLSSTGGGGAAATATPTRRSRSAAAPGTPQTPPPPSGAAPPPPPPPPPTGRPRRAAATTGREDAATEDDEPLPSKSSGTRRKAVARVVTQSQPTQPTRNDRQQQAVVATNHKVIVKKRKSQGEEEEGSRAGRKRRLTTETPISEHSIPVSDHSNRVLVGQLDINKRFPKNYMARHPLKKAPMVNMTISSLWHAVRTLSATPRAAL